MTDHAKLTDQGTLSNHEIIKKAFSGLRAPESIAAGILIKTEIEHPIQPHGKRNKHAFRRTVVFVAFILAVTTTVIAAGVHFGSFDRLKSVIGDDRADLLQPLEISNQLAEQIPDDSLAKDDSIMSEHDAVNKNGVSEDNAAAEKTAADLNTTWNGIRAELVAVGVFDNVVDIYVTLEDLVSNRLTGEFTVDHFIIPVDNMGLEFGSVSHISPEILSRTDDGVVTIRSRQLFSHSLAGLELRYSLNGLNFDIIKYRDAELEVDMSEVTSQPTVLFITDYPHGGPSAPLDEMLEFWASMRTDGMLILEPHLHDIKLGLPGIETIISSIGIIGDKLHIQTYEPFPDWSKSSYMMIKDSQGSDSFGELRVGFELDSSGKMYNPEPVENNPPPPHYNEWVFTIDPDRISDYTLSGFFDTSGYLPLNWSANFEVEQNYPQIIADGLEIPYSGSNITEVRVSPSLIRVTVEEAKDSNTSVYSSGRVYPPEIIIHTNGDASTIIQSSAINNGAFLLYYFYDVSGNTLNQDNITSIEVAGEMIMLR